MIEAFAIYLAAGVFAGLVSGLFGVGGGFTLVPALVIALTAQAMPAAYIMHLSIGTSLAVMVVTALYTAYLRWRSGDLDRTLLGRLAPFIVGGALAGSLIGDALPGTILKAIFIGYVALTIANGLRPRRNRAAPIPGGGDHGKVRGPHLWGIGSVAGLIGGLLGSGPAIVVVPYLRGAAFAMPVATATSAALSAPIGLAAGIGYIWGGLDESGLPALTLGYLYLPAFAGLTLGALAGSPLGIRLSHRIADATQYRMFLAYLTLVLVVMLLTGR
jgi:uncharacterized membrane protein YfcA